MGRSFLIQFFYLLVGWLFAIGGVIVRLQTICHFRESGKTRARCWKSYIKSLLIYVTLTAYVRSLLKENEDRMLDHQACLNGIPHIRSLPERSGGIQKKNYKKAIVTGWIPDIEFLNNKLLRNSSSEMPNLPGASEVDE